MPNWRSIGVQLHGSRGAWPVTEEEVFVAMPLGVMASGRYPPNVSAVFVDSSNGTGRAFDWDEAGLAYGL